MHSGGTGIEYSYSQQPAKNQWQADRHSDYKDIPIHSIVYIQTAMGAQPVCAQVHASVTVHM